MFNHLVKLKVDTCSGFQWSSFDKKKNKMSQCNVKVYKLEIRLVKLEIIRDIITSVVPFSMKVIIKLMKSPYYITGNYQCQYSPLKHNV